MKKFFDGIYFAVGNLNVEFSFCCSTVYNKHLIKTAKSWFGKIHRNFILQKVGFEKFYGNLILRVLAKTGKSENISFQENILLQS